ADPLEASVADAVRAQERALPDGVEHGRDGVTDDLNAAVAAGVLGSEQEFRSLLQSIVEVARAIFSARAPSILLLHQATAALGLFASQAAIALHLLRAARRARAVLAGSPADVAVVARVAAALDALEGARREAGLRLLGELERVLAP